MTTTDEIWILGASGRTGAGIAKELSRDPANRVVLVGRAAARLDDVARQCTSAPRTMELASLDAVAARIATDAPRVVVNTVGPFAATAPPILTACPAGTHYVDLSNELPAVVDVLATHDAAIATSRCVVTAAGFGVAATESIVYALCDGRAAPARVRVDAMAAVNEAGEVGDALAATIVDSIPYGGRRYRDGTLVRVGVGRDRETLTLPDGSTMTTAGIPLGDLEAARRASKAPDVVCASNMVPSGAIAKLVLPIVQAVMSVAAIRRVAKRRLARMQARPPKHPREHSWAHARATWSDGTTREGWLRCGDGMVFTNAVAATVASRLASGEGRPGAYTPCALFGSALVEAAGGTLIIDGR